jgi:hypothetical protein
MGLMIRIIAFIFWITFTFTAIAQGQVKPVEYRFLYGEAGLKDYLKRNSVYPKNSIYNNTIGFSLSSITINRFGAIENIKIINPVDQFIDKEVIRVLRSSASLWQLCDTINRSQTFYIQIAFIISTFQSDILVTSPVKSAFFVGPAVVTVKEFNPVMALNIETNEFLIVKCGILIGCERYEEAVPFIDELIRRNPFSKELYQLRILIYRNMGLANLIDEDLEKMTDFAEGLSLDEILNKN